MKKLINKKFIIFLKIFSILLFWKTITLLNPSFLPSPGEVFQILFVELNNGNLLHHTFKSLFRVIIGVTLGALTGVSLGLLITRFQPFLDLLNDLILVLKSIPPIAWIPLVILWLGIGEASKIYIIAYASFFPIVLNTILGVKSIDKNLLKMAKSMNLKGFQELKEVIIPGALPSILMGLRIGLGVGWMSLIASEMIGATAGLGYMIEESRLILSIPRVIVGMIIIGILGFLGDKSLQRLEKKPIPWL